MPVRTSTDFERCGTCKFWDGKRDVYATTVEYEQFEQGYCENNNTHVHSLGDKVSADNGCSYWESVK